MKLSAALEKAFNDQITLELQASLVYRQLAIELDLMDLPGMSAWLRHQADEEIVHANKFIDHVADRENHPRIGAISAPVVEVESVLDAFKTAAEHERAVSESIRNLYRAADKEGDLDSRPLLNWFLEEQIGVVAPRRRVGCAAVGDHRADRLSHQPSQSPTLELSGAKPFDHPLGLLGSLLSNQ